MHALLVNVTIDAGHEKEAQTHLETNVVPRVKEAAGVVSGYWMRTADGRQGASVILFESEEAARAGAEMAQSAPRPEAVHFDLVEVREVVAQI
jgi:hypothetical protein